MWLYALRRLLMTIPILLGVTIICFALVKIAPGDPIRALLPPGATDADAARLMAMYGLDKPVPMQYLIWLGHVLTGNLGMAISTNTPVGFEVFRALGNTLAISLIAVGISFVLSMLMGVLAAYHIGGMADRIVTAIAVFGISVPTFWLAVVFVIIFAVFLKLLPATGMGNSSSGSFNYLKWDDLQDALMPIFALTLAALGIMMRTTRSSVAEVLNQEFVQTLRAKGMGEFRVVVHAVRNALPQIVAMLGLQLGYLVGGSVLVETVFSWPGTGFLLNKAILARDLPLLQGTILVLAVAFVLLNLIVDLAQSAIDPRIKRA
jgi:peptide/nickel transport system permease protein